MEQKMSKIKTFKGKLPIGTEEKIHLSTRDGMTGYRIKSFEVLPGRPGQDSVELIGQIYLTSKTTNISTTIDFSQADLLGFAYYEDNGANTTPASINRIFDKETFNQDIFVNITDASGGTDPANFYIELEQFKLDLNTSTYHTLKNIRSRTQI